MNEKPSVLITGAAGYVGRLVTEALAASGDALGDVVATDVRAVPEGDRVPGVIYDARDICDDRLADLLRAHRIDTVVHLASVIRPPAGDDGALAYRVDVLGTRNVLDACEAAGVKHFVVTTSGAAYGYHPDNPMWLDEDQPLRGHPSFVYSRNKKAIEEALAAHRARRPEMGQLVLRPCTILGERTRSPITDLFEKRAIVGVAGSESPFVFVWDHDVVACIVRGVLEQRTGIFNLAGDGAMSPREIARRLGKPYLALPPRLLTGALAMLRRLHLTQFGPEQVDFLRYRPVLSNRRLKQEFFTPQKTSLEAFEVWKNARNS